ncbi:MAG: hypothetical protein AAB475_00620, partial [Patescibacteria group bacterium]
MWKSLKNRQIFDDFKRARNMVLLKSLTQSCRDRTSKTKFAAANLSEEKLCDLELRNTKIYGLVEQKHF